MTLIAKFGVDHLSTFASNVVRLRQDRNVQKERPVRVLMVDDDYEDFVLVERLLKSCSRRYRVFQIETVEEAEEAVRKGDHDIALIDNHINDSSGLELIRSMRANDAQVPLILLTGSADPTIDLTALEAGAVDYIDKKDLSSRVLERSIRYAYAQFITEQRLRRSEMAMRAAKEQAEYANAAKSQFLAHMSHELRTPLNAIIGFSELMRDEVMGPVGNDRYVPYVSDIYNSGQHLLTLINDILDLSKIESGQMEYHPEPVNIRELADDCIQVVREQVRSARLDVAVDIDAASYMIVDRRAFKQIMLNLLSNALKFTPKGGSVTVTTGSKAGDLVITVQDTGAGMTKEELRMQSAAMIGMGLMAAPAEVPRPLLAELSAALTSFVNQGGSLTLAMEPAEPVSLGGVVREAQAGTINAEALGLSVTAEAPN